MILYNFLNTLRFQSVYLFSKASIYRSLKYFSKPEAVKEFISSYKIPYDSIDII